jgi:Polyketide cyclase / dehydrase and lipid transport
MTNTNLWTGEHTIETKATAETLWALFRDVASWTTWNAGIEMVRLDGPFAAGTTFTMKPPGQDPLRSTLVEVRANESFVDETRVDDLVVTVAHRLEPLPTGGTRITYAARAEGPGAAEVGPMVTSDFPDVLAALVAKAEGAAAQARGAGTDEPPAPSPSA